MSTLYPYVDFLENEETYLIVQEVWSDLIGRIAAVHGLETVDYMNLSQNGNPVRDGNPVVADKIRGTQKGIRVVLIDPIDDSGSFSAWFNNFGKDSDEAVEELVLDMKMSHATLGISAILIELWMTDRLTDEVLDDWLRPWSFEEE